jgi:transcriptional regulator with XRE-family HTH domain
MHTTTTGRLAWADRVRQARLHRGLRQADLATLADVPRSAVARIESGGGVADHVRLAVSDALGVPWAVLFNLDDLRRDPLGANTFRADEVTRAS